MRNMDVERDQTDEAWHISSVLVTADPSKKEAVCSEILQIPGAELPEVTETEKIVVTLEAKSERQIANALDTIQKLDGVLVASLVYHQTDTTDLNSIVISDQGDLPIEGKCS
ncbi:chaperone NapD [Polycladidibacter hongkongensis]|uniref:chaperone NapD n=1 Tax=Polycladidibacter hongkongensis TaxID=1647556 RepID=UPI00082F6B31|nr:chaperone NapD [Pseudovibrio hongkongensis]